MKTDHRGLKHDDRIEYSILCKLYTQAEVLEGWVSALITENESDMRTQLIDCYKASVKLKAITAGTDKVQTRAAEAENLKKSDSYVA